MKYSRHMMLFQFVRARKGFVTEVTFETLQAMEGPDVLSDLWILQKLLEDEGKTGA